MSLSVLMPCHEDWGAMSRCGGPATVRVPDLLNVQALHPTFLMLAQWMQLW